MDNKVGYSFLFLAIFSCIVLICSSTFLSHALWHSDETYTLHFVNEKNILYVGGQGSGNYTSIQDAVDNASSGDTIFVYSGVYFENIVINKTLELFGEKAETTIIDGNNLSDVIRIRESEGVTIRGFTIRHSGNITDPAFPDAGIAVWGQLGANQTSIQQNIITNNGFGVFLDSSDTNTVSDNNITQNQVGVNLFNGTTDNIIRQNILGFNADGIVISKDSDNNLLYHNSFKDNNNSAYDNCTNTWDNGYPSGGNYWSDYGGTDMFSGPGQNLSNSDDIGDTPYSITGGGNLDRYPLMYPWNETINYLPTIAIIYPVENDTVFGTILVMGTANDSDGTIHHVEVSIDRGPWYNATGTTSWSFNWDTTLTGNGEHILWARSFDGNVYSLETGILVVVENPVETSSISGYLSDGWDDSPIADAEVVFHNETFNRIYSPVTNGTGYYSIPIFPGLFSVFISVEGYLPYSLPDLTIIDGDNWLNITLDIFDNIPPEITLINATPQHQVMGGWVNLSCHVEDDWGVNTVMVNVTYPDNTSINTTMDQVIQTNTYFYYTNYSEIGTYTYFIWANDPYDNYQISEIHSFQITGFAPPIFHFTNLSVNPDIVTVGESLNLSVDVVNTGESGGFTTVYLYVNTTIHYDCNVTVWVNANETETVILSVHPLMMPGVFEVTVGNQTFPSPDLTPVLITVLAPPVFTFSDLMIFPAGTLLVGDSASVEVKVTNSGDTGGNITVFLYVNNALHYDCNVTVWVNANETETVILSVHPLMMPGVFEVTVGNEVSPAHGISPLNLTVLMPPVFSFTNLTVFPAEILVGESVNLQVDVTNEGDIAGPVTLFLYLNTTKRSEYNTTVFLGAKETQTVVLVGITVKTPGVFEVTVGNATGPFSGVTPVALTVLLPPTFRLGDFDIAPPIVLVGEAPNITVNVTNHGDISGNATIYLYVNNAFHHNCNVTVWINAKETVTVSIPVHPLRMPGVYEITLGNQSETASYLLPVFLEVRDETAPTFKDITVLFPHPTPEGWINISVTVSDNVEITNVSLNMTLHNQTPITFSLINNVSNNITYYFNGSFPQPGLYNFYIWTQDSSGNQNTSATTEFWIYETVVDHEILIGENILNVTDEMNIRLIFNSLSNTTVRVSQYPQNPYPGISQQIGFLPPFFNIEIANTSGIQWPLLLTIYFTESDLENASMNSSQLLGIFYWTGMLSMWTPFNNTGVNSTGITGYDGSVWAYLDHLTVITMGGDILPPITDIITGPDGTINYTDITFEWIGEDDFTNTTALEYQYRLMGYTPSWSSWSISQRQSFSDLPQGYYIFEVQARDKAGNIGSPTLQTFTVMPPPNQPPEANFSWTPDIPTDLATVTFRDNSRDSDGNIINWTWDLGEGSIKYGENITHTYPNDGAYIVTLTVKDNDNTVDTIQRTIHVANIPPIPDFIYTINKQTVIFNDTSTDPDGSIASWNWDFGDGHYSVIPNPTHEYAEGGTYTVNLTVTDDDQDVDSYSIIIKIEDEEGLIPGFEPLTLLAAVALIFFLKRKKKLQS